MNHNEKLSQKRLDDLQMLHIDLSRTEWFEHFRDDIIILHNPHIRGDWEPYKLKQVLLVLCNGGNGYGAINLHPIHLQKDTLLIALPSQIAESNNVDENFKATFLLMSEHLLSRINIGDAYMFHKHVENNPLYKLDDRTATTFRSLIGLVHNIMLSGDDNPGMEEIFSLISRLFYIMISRIVNPSSDAQETGHRHEEVMMQFLQLLRQHYRDHRDVGFYADKMSISAKYMTTLVKKASGKSAIQWIEDYVILDAKAQLSSTVNTIQQIAFDLNFPSQSLFGRYFKRAVGMSPSDYRISLRQTHMLEARHNS